MINKGDYELIKQVADVLEVDFETVAWDMSRLSIIEKLLLIIRESGKDGSAEKES